MKQQYAQSFLQKQTYEEPRGRSPSGVVPRGSSVARSSSPASLVLRSLHVYDALAEAAQQHLALGERDEALQTIEDAVDLFESVGDRRPFARVLVGIAECLVDLDCGERAVPLLTEALEHAAALPDMQLAARARRALGRALAPSTPRSDAAVQDALREVMDEEVPNSEPSTPRLPRH